MASKKPYFTSTELIDAVKRNISFPISQQTFSDEDLLQFATEELFLSQVPGILQFHEEYLVYPQVIPLVDNVSRYDIPNRAIGMKLRDLFYQNDNNDLFPMANIGLGNADMYNYNSGSTPSKFYLESDEIVIVPTVKSGVVGSLLAKYYLRPNSLVLNERAAICNAFVKLITVTNASVFDGDILTIGDLILVAGTDFAIGVSNNATATNIANAINTDDLSATANTGILQVIFDDINIDFTTTSAGLTISTQTGIRCNSIPEHFVDGMLIDFLQTEGGHKTYTFDIKVPAGGVSSDSIYFADSQIPSKFVVGDYICEQYECIIPQIPSDLHNLLAEKTCSRVLGALGDKEGAATSNTRIADLEQRQSVILDNRVEGAPRKVVNRHSFLRNRNRRRF